jgi:hypothetical protein
MNVHSSVTQIAGTQTGTANTITWFLFPRWWTMRRPNWWQVLLVGVAWVRWHSSRNFCASFYDSMISGISSGVSRGLGGLFITQL